MENLEQPEDLGSNEFGKFKDAESLLMAYNNLEAEFTKKSQKLASLEREESERESSELRRNEIEKTVHVTKPNAFDSDAINASRFFGGRLKGPSCLRISLE